MAAASQGYPLWLSFVQSRNQWQDWLWARSRCSRPENSFFFFFFYKGLNSKYSCERPKKGLQAVTSVVTTQLCSRIKKVALDHMWTHACGCVNNYRKNWWVELGSLAAVSQKTMPSAVVLKAWFPDQQLWPPWKPVDARSQPPPHRSCRVFPGPPGVLTHACWSLRTTALKLQAP